jgi:hypothetical protein
MRAAVVVAVLAVAAPRIALAQLRTCVRVEGDAAQAESIARLARAELDRHPTHRGAVDDCQGFLTIEVLDLGTVEGKWLTGRINAQVPHRERIGADGLVPAMERLITVLVANDPLVLRGPQALGWLARQRRALEVQSRTRYGAEVYEVVAPLGSGSVASLPGVALTVRREVSAFALGARIGAAFDPATQSPGLGLEAQVDAQLELVLYARPAADVSLFASALVGLEYQRFRGPAPLDGPGAVATATSTGLALAIRGGVEAFRTADVRVVGFVQLEAPAFVSRDLDHGVVDRWIPAAMAGAGILY